MHENPSATQSGDVDRGDVDRGDVDRGDVDRGEGQLVVLDDPAAAACLLDPKRARVLAALAEPGSATTVAAQLGLTRQQVNYHLRALEAQGLLTEVGTRQRRGLTERLVRAGARGYVLSPTVLGDLAADPRRTDRLSASYLIAVAARTVRELAGLVRAAAEAGKQLPTLTLDTDVCFATAAERAAFTTELAETVRTLAAKHHDESAPGGRWHRLLVAAYPKPAEEAATTHDSRPAEQTGRAQESTPVEHLVPVDQEEQR